MRGNRELFYDTHWYTLCGKCQSAHDRTQKNSRKIVRGKVYFAYNTIDKIC